MNILREKQRTQGWMAMGNGNTRDYYNTGPVITAGTPGAQAIYGGRNGDRIVGYQVPKQYELAQQTAANKAAGPFGNNTVWYNQTNGSNAHGNEEASAGHWGDPNSGGGGFLNDLISGVSNGVGGVAQGLSDTISNPDVQKAALIAAAAYGGYSAFGADAAGAGALGDTAAVSTGGELSGGYLAPGTVPGYTAPTLGSPISLAAGDGATLGATTSSAIGDGLSSGFYDYGELGNVPGIATQSQNPSWMSKLSSILPSTSDAASAYDMGKTALGAYGVYNGLQNSNRMNTLAGQLQSTATNSGPSDQAIQDKINEINSQIAKIPTLESLYGQDSPYAKNLMAQLAAKDAAAGRNSQYGQRFQNFQAQLADKGQQYATQYAGAVNSLNSGISSLYNARTNANDALGKNATQIANLQNSASTSNAQSLASLYDLYKNSGVSDSIKNYLSSME